MRVHPARNAAVAGRCAAASGGLRETLQRCPHEQCYWLHHDEGHARRPSAGDPCRARSEAGGGAEATANSPPASRLTFRSRPLDVVLDRFIRMSPPVRSLNFRFADNPGLAKWNPGLYLIVKP